MKQPKHKYYILLNGIKIGETWAVSATKAINNYWWTHVKNRNEYSERYYDPSELDAVLAKTTY